MGRRRVRQLAQAPYLTDREISHGRSPHPDQCAPGGQHRSIRSVGRSRALEGGGGHSLRLNCSTLLVCVKGTQEFSESEISCSPALEHLLLAKKTAAVRKWPRMTGPHDSRDAH